MNVYFLYTDLIAYRVQIVGTAQREMRRKKGGGVEADC